MTNQKTSRRATRRATLTMIAGGLTALSGCAKAVVKSTDEAAGAADEVANKGDEAAQGGSKNGPSGLSGVDNLTNETAQRTTTSEMTEATSTATTTVQDISSFFPLAQVDSEVKVESGHYNYWELFFTEDASTDVTGVDFSYTVIVRDGPNVDVLLIPREELSYFQNGERFEYYTEASRLDTDYANVSGSLSVEDYVFIVDNSVLGETFGSGTAKVTVELKAEEIQ